MNEKRIIQVEEKVPVKMLVPLSIQHMFAMFGASVLVPFIFGINPAVVLFMNGLGNVGIGTAIYMICTGPAVHFFIKKFSRIVKEERLK